MIFGALIDHGRAVFDVALLFPLAGFLAFLLPPGKSKLTTAGGWLVTGYLLLGVVLFFGSGGSVGFHSEGKDGAILVALLVTSLALPFLRVVGERSSNAHLVAATMFAVVAAWGGLINYLKERVTEPSFDLTAVVRKPASAAAPREPVGGFLIARTGDAMQSLSPTTRHCSSSGRGAFSWSRATRSRACPSVPRASSTNTTSTSRSRWPASCRRWSAGTPLPTRTRPALRRRIEQSHSGCAIPDSRPQGRDARGVGRGG